MKILSLKHFKFLGRKISKRRCLQVLICTLMVFAFFTVWKRETQIWEYGIGVDNSVNNLCQIPHLYAFDSNIMSYFANKKIHCPKDVEAVIIRDGKIEIADYYKKHNIPIKCEITYIYRDGDFDLTYSPVQYLNFSSSLNLNSDFFKAVCKNSKNHVIYRNIHAGISKKSNLHERTSISSNGLGVNVIMIGFDSVSHMTFLRKLPKSFAYFSNVLGGEVLNGYNILGDGTPAALIPILTGQTETELPSTLKEDLKLDENIPSHFVDVYPLIWKDFQKQGYVTMWGEDFQTAATFQYRMRGFNEQPTDYYMRPFQLQVIKDSAQHEKFCLASRPRYKVFLDWIKDFCDIYQRQRKFVFTFFNDVSHNYLLDYLSNADEDLLSLLQHFKLNNYLDNTILVLFGDHGARIGKIRTTFQGKQEERLPMMGFAFPTWFKQKYPEAFRNFQINVNRLTSPFDIHATLKHILYFHERPLEKNIRARNISLLHEIPRNRTCQDSNIKAHWCTCLQWHVIDKKSVIIQNAAQAIVDHINALTFERRDVCSPLELQEIVKSLSLLPDKKFFKFQGSKDIHGLVPDFGGITSVDNVDLQITIRTRPGNGLFEVSLTYQAKYHTYIVHKSDISRINKYGDAPHCVMNYKKDLRKYCYCSKQNESAQNGRKR